MALDWNRGSSPSPTRPIHTGGRAPFSGRGTENEGRTYSLACTVRQQQPESKPWPQRRRQGCQKPLSFRACLLHSTSQAALAAAGMQAGEAPWPPPPGSGKGGNFHILVVSFHLCPTCPLLPNLLPHSSRAFPKGEDLPPHTQALPQCSKCSINHW